MWLSPFFHVAVVVVAVDVVVTAPSSSLLASSQLSFSHVVVDVVLTALSLSLLSSSQSSFFHVVTEPSSSSSFQEFVSC